MPKLARRLVFLSSRIAEGFADLEAPEKEVKPGTVKRAGKEEEEEEEKKKETDEEVLIHLTSTADGDVDVLMEIIDIPEFLLIPRLGVPFGDS